MKANHLLIWLPIVLIFLLTGCGQNVTLYKQAQQQYNQGNYENSFKTVVQSLQLKPSYVKAQVLVNDVYPKAIAAREDNIQKLMASTNSSKYDGIVAEYAALDVIQTTAKKLPPLSDPKTGTTVKFDVKDYSVEWNNAKNNAAEYHYQNGIKIKNSSSDVDNQKLAAKEFKTAMSFVEDYKESAMFYDQCRKLGIKRIAIIPFIDKSGSNGKYGALEDLMVDGIVTSITNDPASTEFLEIITRDQINTILSEQKLSSSGLVDENSAAKVGILLGAHEIMTGKILQIVYTPERTVSKQFSETAKVKIGEETYYDDKGKKKTKDVMGDVTCDFTHYTKSCKATITGSYTIIDVSTGKVKKQDSFTAEMPWSDDWGVVGNGDQRALSSNTIKLCQKSEPLPPIETDMVTKAMNGLVQTFVRQFKSYVQ